jgi:hypothetical protein
LIEARAVHPSAFGDDRFAQLSLPTGHAWFFCSARIERRLAGKKPANLFGRLFGRDRDGAHGRAGDVGCERDIRQPQQRPVRRNRLDRV